MAKQQLTDFSLPTDAYATFDAVSLKSHIKDRLTAKGFFTDQNFEGSNLSSLIDIMAYSYHTLLFYLNQTATETLFTEAELYENMNRIVKMMDYKPVGSQTSNLSFKLQAPATLSTNTYTIPRYSFVDAGGTFFSFKEDVAFSKTVEGAEVLTDTGNKHLLYEGKFEEYPLMHAVGEKFETFVLVPGDDVIIDYFNIDVYVKDVASGTWSEWKRVSSLYLEDSTSKSFEVRLNENRRVELKFGDDVNGRRLTTGDQIAVYYINSTGVNGEVGVNAIDGSVLLQYNTVQFTTIFNIIKDANINYMTDAEVALLELSNSHASTDFYDGETVGDIRERAPDVFSSQYRVVTKTDYERHILQDFSNIISDVKVVNNWDYLDGHFKYLTETLKLDAANNDPNTLYNQVTFADSCDFNNVYVYAVPSVEKLSSGIIRTNYLTASQKSAIISSLRDKKSLTTEVVIVDPVYMSVDIGVAAVGETAITSLKDVTKLQLVRENGSGASLEKIQNSAYTIVKDYIDGLTLGSTIDITSLTNDLLNITGVSKIQTVRTDTALSVDGLSLMTWNPIYPSQDVSILGSNQVLQNYQYPYLDDPAGFLNKIEAVAAVTSTGMSEY